MTKRFKYITVDAGDCLKIYPLDDKGKLLKKPERNPKRKMRELVQELSMEPMEPLPTKEDKEVQVQPQLLLTFPPEVMDHLFQSWKKSFESPTKGGSA